MYVIINDIKYYVNDIKNRDNLNSTIKTKLINSGEIESNIENIDYVKYFNENKDLIFKLNNIKGDIIDNIDMKYDLFYSTIIALILFMILIHYLYYKITSNLYVITLLILLVILSIYMRFTLNNN